MAFDRLVALATYVPPRCRYSPDHPPKFTLALNLLFAFSATFTVANLYYNHPILNKLAVDFGVSDARIADIPTLMQAGYAGGLLFLNPLGDALRRRAMVLVLVGITAACWIGLCVTRSFAVFEALSFLAAFFTVAPQIFLPLVADLAPPARRPTAIAVVSAGMLLGMLIARILSGVVTQFVGWRTIYWIALGLQGLIFGLLWAFMPDYPPTNPAGINYFRSLWSLLQLIARHPVLVQASLIGLFMSAIFTLYWTTLTFLLAAPPYQYDSLVIGLFGLIGIAGICLGPPTGRWVIQKHHTHFSVALGLAVGMAGQAVGAYAGEHSVAGPAIQALLLDLGIQATQVSNRTAIYKLDPNARNRLNTVYMLCVFCGQILGTSSGSPMYQRYGWIGSGSLGVAYVGAAMVVLALRGPHETRWVGWRGGWSVWRNLGTAESPAITGASPSEKTDETVDEEKGAGYGAESPRSVGEKASTETETETEKEPA